MSKEILIRSNIFLPRDLDVFLRREAKQRKTTKTRLLVSALRSYQRQLKKEAMDAYYSDEKNVLHEVAQAQEWVSVYPLRDVE